MEETHQQPCDLPGEEVGDESRELPAFLERVPVDVEILLGETQLRVKEILSLSEGFLVRMPRKAGSDFLMHVNGARLAWVRPTRTVDRTSFVITGLDLTENSAEPEHRQG